MDTNIEWIASSSALILLIILIRFLFRHKISPRFLYALWLVAAIRLLLPFSIFQTQLSILNLLPMQGNGGERVAGEEFTGITSFETDSVKESLFNIMLTNFVPEASPDASNGAGSAEEIKADREKFADTESFAEPDIGKLLRFCRLFGTSACGMFFLLVNWEYSRRLRRSRKQIAMENLPTVSIVPVYETEMVLSPCLFGLFRPAVYVNRAVTKENERFLFVLAHENAHYKNHDNWWSLVRILCVCLHWYNPLVWLAVFLSRQDGELACDERTLKHLDKEKRMAYGKTLLSLSALKVSGMERWRISTGMRGNNRQLRERLQLIVHTPEKSVYARLALLLLMPFVLAVSFTGKGKVAWAKQESMENASAAETIENERAAGAVLETTESQENTNEHSTAAAQPNTVAQTAAGEMEAGEPALSEYVEIECYYDENNREHMERYIEENPSDDAVFKRLELIYVEDDSIYTLPATTDDNVHLTMIAMAKQALVELYEWTGEKVDTAYFQVSNLGGVTFASSLEDMEHSRIFYSRYFGADTDYNLSGYDRAISTRDIASGRIVWYSPLLWRRFPASMDEMTDEEVIIWYMERLPGMGGDRVISIEKRYEDIWTIQTASGSWYEVFYNNSLREISGVYGPYPDYPQH